MTATNEYTITITVEEGERYTFGDIGVESTLTALIPKMLDAVIETRQGNVYSAKDVEDSLIAHYRTGCRQGLCLRPGDAARRPQFREPHDFGRLYRSIRVRAPMSSASRSAATTAPATTSFAANSTCEGDAFNQVLIQRAKRRLEALDFFTTVNISTAPGSEADQVILVVDVVEKSTGEFSVGAGYTTGRPQPPGRQCRGLGDGEEFPRPRPVHQDFGRRRQGFARLHTCLSPSPISSAAVSRPAFDLTQSTRTETNYATVDQGRHGPIRPADHRCAVGQFGLQSAPGNV